MPPIVMNAGSNVVQEPHLHDAILVDIRFSAGSIQLRFRTAAGPLVCVVLSKIRGFSAEPLFEVNIAFEMRVIPVVQAQLEDCRRALHITGNSETHTSMVNELKLQPLLLVQIEPTLGADILAICGDVTWEYDVDGSRDVK